MILHFPTTFRTHLSHPKISSYYSISSKSKISSPTSCPSSDEAGKCNLLATAPGTQSLTMTHEIKEDKLSSFNPPNILWWDRNKINTIGFFPAKSRKKIVKISHWSKAVLKSSQANSGQILIQFQVLALITCEFLSHPLSYWFSSLSLLSLS